MMYDMGKKPKRQYTESDKATALALLVANKGNVKRTAKELGIPEPTLRKWHKGVHGVTLGVVQKYDEKKEELDDLFERVARAYLDHALSPDVLAKTNGRDAVITAATATDKRQLLKGKPTGITGHRFTDMNDDDLDRRIAELERRETALTRGAAIAPGEGEGRNVAG